MTLDSTLFADLLMIMSQVSPLLAPAEPLAK